LRENSRCEPVAKTSFPEISFATSAERKNISLPIVQSGVGGEGELEDSMKRNLKAVLVVLAELVVASAIWAQNGSQPISAGRNKMAFNQLPQVVQNTIRLYAGTVPLHNVSQVQINGQSAYRAEFNRKGINHELFVSPDGNVAAQVQETASAIAPMQSVRPLSLSDTPKPVQQSVRQHAHDGLVTDVNEADWNGQNVYSVIVNNHGRISQYVFDQNGKVLSEPGQPVSEAAGAQPNHSKEPDTDAQHDNHILQHPK
jgi:hypothetical protein